MAFPFDVLSWLVRLRYKVTSIVLADGEAGEMQGDANGNLKTRVMAEGPPGLTAVRQKTAAAAGTLKASPGSLYEITVWNTDAAGIWLQIHDKASAASAGETCVDQVYVPAGATVGWRPLVPVACAIKIQWAASTAPGTLTAASAVVGLSAAVL
jgi:hypothetical protein